MINGIKLKTYLWMYDFLTSQKYILKKKGQLETETVLAFPDLPDPNNHAENILITTLLGQ